MGAICHQGRTLEISGRAGCAFAAEVPGEFGVFCSQHPMVWKIVFPVFEWSLNVV